jgi:hypothetical protein
LIGIGNSTLSDLSRHLPSPTAHLPPNGPTAEAALFWARASTRIHLLRDGTRARWIKWKCSL